jgi:PAS domain S-box-containing protein
MGSEWTTHGGYDPSPEEVLHLLERNIRDYAIFMLDPDGWVLTWNAGAERIKGYRADEIIGRHFSTFYPEAEVAGGKPERLLSIARRDGRVEDEGWRVRKDGTRFWANVVITALYDDSGELRGFGKVTSDVTKRHDAEKALRESEERFRLLVQDTSDYAIFMLDPTGRVVSWNAGAQRIKGYEADEIIGKHFSVFYPRQDLAAGRPAQNLQTALLAGRVEDEGWRVRKDGTRFWANIVITALYDEQRRLRGFGKVTRDVTERRASERALRDWDRQLQAQQAEQRRIGQAVRDGAVKELNSIARLQESLAAQLSGPEAVQLRSLTERLSRSVDELSVLAGKLSPPEVDSQSDSAAELRR